MSFDLAELERDISFCQNFLDINKTSKLSINLQKYGFFLHQNLQVLWICFYPKKHAKLKTLVKFDAELSTLCCVETSETMEHQNKK